MQTFNFSGTLPASKSILNRAQIVHSYFSNLKIIGDSACDDVLFLKKALVKLHQELAKHSSFIELECGEGGTTFRFLVMHVSRFKGKFFLKASPRLMKRPQVGLIDVLQKLGVSAELKPDGIVIESRGWHKPSETIYVPVAETSQFASALLLSCWSLDFDISFKLSDQMVSESYFQMTQSMLQQMGMSVFCDKNIFSIPQKQTPNVSEYYCEPDISSAFVFAAAGALFGSCELLSFPKTSLQPDIAFLEIFKEMGILTVHLHDLKISKATTLKPIRANLALCPDLFPVLAVLCSFCEGTSELYGAPHLVNKESNRIQKVAELFDLIGISYKATNEGMIIHGEGMHSCLDINKQLIYDPSHDHRMVMAASLLRKAGYPLHILNPEAVNKSMPEFFKLFQGHA